MYPQTAHIESAITAENLGLEEENCQVVSSDDRGFLIFEEICMLYICVKSLLQDNFNTAKMIIIGPQTVVVLSLEHGPPS